MGLLDEYKDQINAHFSEWIKVNNEKTGCGWTIEDFPYNIGVDEDLTDPHCWKCVTVNQCWFKNEEDKKPKHFDYSNYTFNEMPKSIRGLYHPNCHCREYSINVPKEKDIKLIIPKGKIEWLYRDKIHKIHEFGYHSGSEWKIIDALVFSAGMAFQEGKYSCNIHDEKGYRITIFTTIKGINHRQGEILKIKAGYTIFPNGQLKCNTLWGGEWK